MAMLFMWMEAWMHWAKYLGYEWYNRLKWLVVQVLSIVALLIVLVWLSMFMYGSFYYTYMPAVTHTRDVHLQYRTDCEVDGQLCSFPTANLSLTREGQSELLMRGQPYVIVLGLDMPESPVNRHLGMFMVKVQLYARHGEIVHTSSRSVLLSYKSTLYQAIETICLLPMLLTGTRSQKQQVSVTLFDSYEEDPYRPSVGAVIEVQTKKVEIYSATLKIHAKFAGLRYLLYHWPTISALCGVGANLFFLVLMTLLSWYRFGVVPNEDDDVVTVGTQRLTLEERRSRIRAMLDRERSGHAHVSGSGVAYTGMHHAYSQPNLSHRRSASASFSAPANPENLHVTHSASTSNLEALGGSSQQVHLLGSAGTFRISNDSLATTDGDDDQQTDSEKNYSTPSSGSGSRHSETPTLEGELRHRQTSHES